jgi:hypothetical protein
MKRLGIRLTGSGLDSKAEYYALARRGLLGNTLQQWKYLDFINEYLIGDEPMPTKLGLRCSVPGSSLQGTDLTVDVLVARVETEIKAHRVDPSTVYVDACAPDHLLTLQGEVMLDTRHYYLRYNTVPGLRMRQAYPTMRHAHGLTALQLIKRHVCPDGQDAFQYIWDAYSNAIIEFTAFRCPVGQLRWKTLIWEARCF